MEDHEIIALFFARDERAITALGEKYGPLCHRLARNILGSRDDAEECVNDAYLGVWNTVPPREPDPLVAYLCRITRNLALARCRRNRAQKRTADLVCDELAALCTRETPESHLAVRELTAAIERWLDAQSELDRALFVRRYWFADELRAIAPDLGLSENAASVRLHRLRKRLSATLQKEGML